MRQGLRAILAFFLIASFKQFGIHHVSALPDPMHLFGMASQGRNYHNEVSVSSSVVSQEGAEASYSHSHGGGGGGRRRPLMSSPEEINARIRSQWEELSRICPNRNYASCEHVDRSKWTDPRKTEFSTLTFHGLGKWSTFKMTTFDKSGARRQKGGDSWFLLLRDYNQRLRVSVRIFDDGDGTYTGAAHFLFPGNYTLWGWLYYSDCHGLQEPELSLDLHYMHILKKKDHCWEGGRIRRPGLLQVPYGSPAPTCLRQGCSNAAPQPEESGKGLTWRMETYYYRQNHTYQEASCCKPRLAKPAGPPVSRFLFYGDSTVKNSWELLMYPARRPCKVVWRPRMIHELFGNDCPTAEGGMAEVDPKLDKILKRCTAGAPWTSVPVGTNTDDVSRYHALSMLFNMDKFSYNDTYARHHVPPVPLPVPREFTVIYMNGKGSAGHNIVQESLKSVRPGDVLVINMGAHYSRTMTFKDWQALMDKMATEFKRIIAETKVTIVWRTSFLMKEHVFRNYKHADGYVPPAHFNTDARRLMFESYAEAILAPLGVHIWDVFGICAMGDFRPHDMVHADGATSWAQNTDMMDLFVCHD